MNVAIRLADHYVPYARGLMDKRLDAPKNIPSECAVSMGLSPSPGDKLY